MSAREDNAVALVARGYTEATRVLDFRVGFRTAEGAAAACEAIGSYNAFSGWALADWLREGEERDAWAYHVGREGSPVLYVDIFAPEDADVEAHAESLRALGADEVSFDGHLLRAWWD